MHLSQLLQHRHFALERISNMNMREDCRFYDSSLLHEEHDFNVEEFHRKSKAAFQSILTKLERRLSVLRKPSIYTGRNGLTILFLAICDETHTISDFDESDRNNLLKKALSLTDNAAEEFHSSNQTFLTGISGVLALRALTFYHLGDTLQSLECLRSLLHSSRTVANFPPEECEVLYGRAGYLFSLLVTKRVWSGTEVESTFVKLIYTLISQIIATGQSFASSHSPGGCWPLYYEWHNKCYLGAAHGIAGILMVVLHAAKVFKEDSEELAALNQSGYEELIFKTVDFVLENHMFPSGNIASSASSKSDLLVHWCHGAPGWIPLIIELCKMTDRSSHNDRHLFYRRHVEALGEVVWQRGLLKKGLGLCHGVGGNAFAFLSLYRYTKESRWLKRARLFASFGIEYYNELFALPDSPYSLFEGVTGFCFLLHALYSDPASSFFPGYELLD